MGSWVGTRAFYAAEAVGGISGAAVGWWTTGDALQGGASGLALGAALTAPLVLLVRACALVARTGLRRIVEIALEEVPPDQAKAAAQDLEARFDAYYRQQLEKLEHRVEEVRSEETLTAWEDLQKLAWRTVTGLDSFSGKVSEYLTITIRGLEFELRQPGHASFDRAAKDLLEAFREARLLFSAYDSAS